jgi:hypothetical protein
MLPPNLFVIKWTNSNELNTSNATLFPTSARFMWGGVDDIHGTEHSTFLRPLLTVPRV